MTVVGGIKTPLSAQRPAEALLMAIAGRRGVAGELSGPGRAKLASRAASRTG
jgi:hypothetical protein